MRFFQYDFSEFAAAPAMRFDLATTPGFNPLPEILFHLRPDKEIQPIEFAGKFVMSFAHFRPLVNHIQRFHLLEKIALNFVFVGRYAAKDFIPGKLG